MDEIIRVLSPQIPAIIVAIFTGLMALTGVYVGGMLNRRTQYRSWLLEKRAENYERFWQTFDSCTDAIKDYRQSAEWQQDAGEIRDTKIQNLAISFHRQAKISRLFASERVKDQIEKLQSSFGMWCKSNTFEPPKKPNQGIEEAIKDITAGITPLIRMVSEEAILRGLFEKDLKRL